MYELEVQFKSINWYLLITEFLDKQLMISESALPVHRHSRRGHQTHPAAFLVSAGMWLHYGGLL